MPYPETIAYIKKQVEEGFPTERIRSALEESGYQDDVIDELFEKAGVVSHIKSKPKGIDAMVLRSVGVAVLLLFGVGFIFMSSPFENIQFSPSNSPDISLGSDKKIELSYNEESVLPVSNYLKDPVYSASESRWFISGGICIDAFVKNSELHIISEYMTGCPSKEKLRIETLNPDGKTAAVTMTVIVGP